MDFQKNKNLNSIIKIILFFIIIPFFILFVLKDYSVFSFNCGNITISGLNHKTIISFGSILAAILSIFFEINKEKRINESRFTLDLNNNFSKNKDVNDLFFKLISDTKESNELINFLIKEKNKSIIFEYICFFESINVLLSKKILKISAVSNLFSRRFYAFTNNPKVQEYFILENREYLKNIYQLHDLLTTYRRKQHLVIYNEKYSLDVIDPDYNKALSTSLMERIDIKYILTFIIFVILFLLFVICSNIISRYFCTTLNVEISLILSFISGFVGVISVLNSTIRTRRVTEGRFITDLNTIFISNNKISKIVSILEDEKTVKKMKHINKENRSGISEYLIFFETVYNSLEEKAISIKEIDKLFCKRFFMLVNNKVIQKEEIIEYSEYHNNIYTLYKIWTKYRNKHNLMIPFEENALDKNDPNFNNVIKKHFTK